MTQDNPFTLKVELTEGCNLRCPFCAMNAIRAPKEMRFNYMTPETADLLARQVADAGWNPRIEFTMRGEPSLNPRKIEIIAIFRAWLPKVQLMMTSNGGGVVADPVEGLKALFGAGLNVFVLDEYEEVELARKIMRKLDNELLINGLPFDVRRHPEDPDSSPHKRFPKNTRLLVRMQDIKVATAGTHATLNNHAGLGAAPEVKNARCAKPFRECVVWWDGSVKLCCNDWEGRYSIANIHKTPLKELWQGPEYTAARRILYAGKRNIKPCQWCNDRSYRIGLLPDKFGKQTLPAPTTLDYARAHQCSTQASVPIQPLRWVRK